MRSADQEGHRTTLNAGGERVGGGRLSLTRSPDRSRKRATRMTGIKEMNGRLDLEYHLRDMVLVTNAE